MVQKKDQFLHHGNRTVPSSGASYPDFYTIFLCSFVLINNAFQQRIKSLQQCFRFFTLHHIVGHFGHETGFRPEMIFLIRVWKKTNIKNIVNILGDTIFKPEGEHFNIHYLFTFILHNSYSSPGNFL